MRTWIKTALTPLALALATTALVACGSGGDASGGSGSEGSEGPSEVRVGVLLPLSGPSATLGEFARDGLTAAVDAVNDAGGIRSMDGARVRLVFADHHLDTDAGRAAAQQLLDQDRVSAIVGSSYSDMSLVLSQLCALRGVPCVSTDAADDIVDRGEGWMFRPLPSMTSYTNSLLEAYRSFGAPANARVASVVSQGDLGDAVAKAAAEGVEAHGWTSTGTVEYAPTTKNFLPIAQQLKGKNPDAVVALSYGEAPQLVKAFRESGFEPVVLGVSSGWASSPLIDTLRAQADGIFASATFDADMIDSSRELEEVAAAYERRTGSIPDAQFWIFFGAGQYLQAALEQAGSTDPEELKSALGSVKMRFADPLQPILDGIDMQDGENVAARPPVLQIQDQRQVTVWPDEVARGRIRPVGGLR